MTKNADDLSEEISPIPFRLPSQEIFSTPTRMKTVSPLSVPEIGNKQKLNESTEKDEEEDNNTKSDKMTDEEKEKNAPPPKISYNAEGDLEGYKTTQMDIELAEIFDGEYVRNTDGTHLDGDIADDLI